MCLHPLLLDNFMDDVKEGYQDDDTCKAILASRGTAMLSVRDGYIYKGRRLVYTMHRFIEEEAAG